MITSPARFKVAIAGRGSGKTEWWMREVVRRAWSKSAIPNSNFAIMAPTRDQVKRIYWKSLKALVPRSAIVKDPSETELSFEFTSGTTLMLVGMDKPQRLEGIDLQLALLDEYADWKEGAWEDSVEPTLRRIGREGVAIFIGRPRSRNHFWRLVQDYALNPDLPEWDYFHWRSADIMTEAEIAQAKRIHDPRGYARNYEAKFEDDGGRVYYCFDRQKHALESLRYNPAKPLILCFDFNRKPGVCAYVQEMEYSGTRKDVAREYTGVFGEVWIPDDSNSEKVALRVVADFSEGGKFGRHSKNVPVYLEGDATGGAKGSAKIAGSDWDIIMLRLKASGVFGPVYNRVPESNPAERARINAVNARLLTADGTVKMLVDPNNAPHVVEDFEQVAWDKSGTEIEKEQGGPLTHISDGCGYYIFRRHPIVPPSTGGVISMG
jgi:hypothetical protein